MAREGRPSPAWYTTSAVSALSAPITSIGAPDGSAIVDEDGWPGRSARIRRCQLYPGDVRDFHIRNPYVKNFGDDYRQRPHEEEYNAPATTNGTLTATDDHLSTTS